MIAFERRVAYTYACLEVEVEICIMSFCGVVVKSGYRRESVDERWLAEGHKPCYALDVPLLMCHRISGDNSIGIIMLYATIRLIL
jgi:hypothetical protein